MRRIARKKKIDVMKGSQFYGLMKSPTFKNCRAIIKKLFECYDANKKKYSIRRGDRRIFPREIAWLLGLKDTGKTWFRDTKDEVENTPESYTDLCVKVAKKDKKPLLKSIVVAILQHINISDETSKLIFKKLIYFYYLSLVKFME